MRCASYISSTSVVRIIRLHHINTFWGMSLGNCLEWKIKHFSYCCRFLYNTNISYDVGYIFLYDVIYATIFGNRPNFCLFCILQSNSTLTSSYLCTPSIFLYQVLRECARTLTIVAGTIMILSRLLWSILEITIW